MQPPNYPLQKWNICSTNQIASKNPNQRTANSKQTAENKTKRTLMQGFLLHQARVIVVEAGVAVGMRVSMVSFLVRNARVVGFSQP